MHNCLWSWYSIWGLTAFAASGGGHCVAVAGHQVLHSDLKVRNVLLKSDASPRGCIAKVADFGLAVKMDCMDTHISAFQVCMQLLMHGPVWRHAVKQQDSRGRGSTSGMLLAARAQ